MTETDRTTYFLTVDISDDQRNNLSKLADLLDSVPESKPENYRFDMGMFFRIKSDDIETLHELDPNDDEIGDDDDDPYMMLKTIEAGKRVGHTCGTTSCAMGYALFSNDIPAPEPMESWGDYGRRVFGAGGRVLLADVDNEEEDAKREALWDFLFSGSWSTHFNDPRYAAKRIRYFLERGLPSYSPVDKAEHSYGLINDLHRCNYNIPEICEL